MRTLYAVRTTWVGLTTLGASDDGELSYACTVHVASVEASEIA